MPHQKEDIMTKTATTSKETPIKTWPVPAQEPDVYPVAAYRLPDGVRVVVQAKNGNVLMSSRAKKVAWELRHDSDLAVDQNGGIIDDGGMFPFDLVKKARCERIESDKHLENIRFRRVFRFTRGL
jgi:glucose/arabinose dehydrogenase